MRRLIFDRFPMCSSSIVFRMTVIVLFVQPIVLLTSATRSHENCYMTQLLSKKCQIYCRHHKVLYFVLWLFHCDLPYRIAEDRWSNEGCSVHQSNDTYTVCHCSHMTSFALLMDELPPQVIPTSYDHLEEFFQPQCFARLEPAAAIFGVPETWSETWQGCVESSSIFSIAIWLLQHLALTEIIVFLGSNNVNICLVWNHSKPGTYPNENNNGAQ